MAAKTPGLSIPPWAQLVLLAAAAAMARFDAAPGAVGSILGDMSNNRASQRDLELQTKNYYEVLTDTGGSMWTRGGLARMVSRALGRKVDDGGDDGNWVNLKQTELIHETDDPFLPYELRPGAEQIFMGAPTAINRWGMRDRDYEQTPPPGVFRIALIGASNSMGYGVPLEDVYSERFEQRLNAERPGGPDRAYEVLNFSVGGMQMLDRLYMVDTKLPRFEPDLILVCATMHDLRWAIYNRLGQQVREGRELHFDFLRELVAKAGITPDQRETKMNQKLSRYRQELALGCFQELGRISDRTGIPIAVVNLRLRTDPVGPDLELQSKLARDAGLPTIDLYSAYEGQDPRKMYLKDTDPHPTSAANALLADELWNDLRADAALWGLIAGDDGSASGATLPPG